MNRFRLQLSLLLGLALLVHGAILPAAQAAKPMQAQAMSAMPCTGTQMARMKCHDTCCNKAQCVDLAGCTLAQPSLLASQSLAVVASDAGLLVAARESASAPMRPPSSLLRPPIVLHG